MVLLARVGDCTHVDIDGITELRCYWVPKLRHEVRINPEYIHFLPATNLASH
jgi:hypothetical protein